VRPWRPFLRGFLIYPLRFDGLMKRRVAFVDGCCKNKLKTQL
jgi:hypothetical protein